MSDRAIIESIRKIADRHKSDDVTYVDATVDSVNVSKRICSCTCIGGHTEYKLPTVKLMAVVDDGILFEPVIGSTVKVIFSQNIEPFICQYSEIENITIDAKTNIQFNDGSFGGLIKVKELTDKINALESDLNTLKNIFTQWVPVLTDGGTALKTVSASWYSKRLNVTDKSELTNDKITHGK